MTAALDLSNLFIVLLIWNQRIILFLDIDSHRTLDSQWFLVTITNLIEIFPHNIPGVVSNHHPHGLIHRMISIVTVKLPLAFQVALLN